MLSLPPVLTYLGALILKLEKFEFKRAFGVAIALSGSLVLAYFKIHGGAVLTWAVAAFFGAVFLANGNLYRTLKWPKGQTPEVLAPLMLLSAFLQLSVSCIILRTFPEIQLQLKPMSLVFIQSMTFAFQYILFFYLQKLTGPVYLSYIGSVSALFAFL
jgi:drug/metabolite transporter (DMT)-like permease